MKHAGRPSPRTRFRQFVGRRIGILTRPRGWNAAGALVVVWLLFGALSCTQSQAPAVDYPKLEAPATNWRTPVAGPAQAQDAGRLRAVATLHEQMLGSRASTADLLEDAHWSSPQWRTSVEHNDAGLLVAHESSPATINTQPHLPAWRYNTLAANIKTAHIGAVRLRWRSSWRPSEYSDAAELRIITANEENTYVFALHAGDRGAWRGNIDDLELEIDTPRGTAEISSVELRFDHTRAREGMLIHDTYMEAIYSPHFEWRVTVPENGQLEFHIASLQRLESQRQHLVRTRVYKESDVTAGATAPLGEAHVFPIMDRAMNVENDADSGTEVFRQTLPPIENETDRDWTSVQVDLSEYAGEAVVLRFESGDAVTGTPLGIAWGNPMLRPMKPKRSRTPIILISNDSLRAANLSAYGYHRETTPDLDAFRDDAVLYEQAIAPEPWTLSAHMSMLTGLYPHHHGANATSNLSTMIPTLPERLSEEADYRTEGVTGHRWWLDPSRGFGRGFDRYTPFTYVDGHFIPIGEMQPMVLQWLDAHVGDNLFLFYHNYDIHSKFEDTYPAPYWPVEDRFLHFSKEMGPVPDFRAIQEFGDTAEQLLAGHNLGRHTIPDDMRAYMVALYDDCIRMVDHYLGALFAHLKELDIYDDALIIVTADHGESFDEHGEYLHVSLHETNLHVPLMVKYPDNWRAGARVSEQVSLTSLYPTILEAAGLAPRGELEAPSLQALLEEADAQEERVYAWNDVYRSDFMARDYPWKLIYDKAAEAFQLFNLLNDPGEKQNLWQEDSENAASLSKDIEAFYFTDMRGLFVRVHMPESEYARVLLELDATSWDARLSAPSTYEDPVLRETSSGLIEAHLPLRADGHGQIFISAIEGESVAAKLDIYMDGPWQIMLGDDFSTVEMRHEAEFELKRLPANRSTNLPDAFDPELPLVEVWHGAITGPQTQAEDLSTDAQDELEALGYF